VLERDVHARHSTEEMLQILKNRSLYCTLTDP